jgi:hypothetical protein
LEKVYQERLDAFINKPEGNTTVVDNVPEVGSKIEAVDLESDENDDFELNSCEYKQKLKLEMDKNDNEVEALSEKEEQDEEDEDEDDYEASEEVFC